MSVDPTTLGQAAEQLAVAVGFDATPPWSEMLAQVRRHRLLAEGFDADPEILDDIREQLEAGSFRLTGENPANSTNDPSVATETERGAS